MTASTKAPNRLIRETSPYLLQHAENPVDWYPWGEEAFDKAAREDKPVFLSIGYSACHWCHVMEREVFEDEEAARFLNRVCVNVKVDREERPDVDAVYMESCAVLTGGGGWPLSVFLTPDKKPFFAGTYMPRHTMIKLLERIETLWHHDRRTLESAAESVLEELRNVPEAKRETDVDALSHEAFVQLSRRYDAQYGGFGHAPKFPSPQVLMFLQRYGAIHPETRARTMALYTLERMTQGGLFDHVGGGFFRYSTDRQFKIPHFEKMLYDNAMLALVYAEAGLYDTAERVLDFCFRELRSPEGAFYTALDADSDGTEGGFYLLTPSDVTEALGPDAKRYAALFDITEQGNYEGKSHANLLESGPMSPEDAEFAAECRARLLKAREMRIRPMRDEKILLSSNGLMLAALATCGRIMGRREYIDAAVTLADFLELRFNRNGRYVGVWQSGKQGSEAPLATLDDYAYYAWGLYRLHQATLEETWLTRCAMVCDGLELFDGGGGALYLAGEDVTDLPLRPRNTQDGALPSGNAIAAGVTRRLYLLTGEERWGNLSDRIIRGVLSEAEYPAAYTATLSAALLGEYGRKAEIPLSGSLREAAQAFHPFAAVRCNANAQMASVCTENGCLRPTKDAEELSRQLEPRR